MMHVVYIVKAINLASLKFSGILRVMKAYNVHKSTRSIAYANEIEVAKSVTLQSSMTLLREG